MPFAVELSPQVKLQARSISDWYRRRSGSEAVADRWLQRLQCTVDSLTEDPQRFPLARESGDFDFDLHDVHFGSGRKHTHRVLFRIEGSTVHVMAIRHVSQQDVKPDTI